MSTVSELKNRFRKTVTSPITQLVYGIRKVSQMEFSRAQLSMVMPADDTLPESKTLDRMLVETGLKTLNAMEFVLGRGVVEPTLVFGTEPADMPEGHAHIDWISEDQAWLYSEILKHSGLDDESQEALRGFLKNAHGSETSTKSEEPLASSPLSS